MKINNIDVLVASKESRINSNTKLEYWSVGLMTLDDGSNFNISVKEKEKADVLQPMTKYNVSVNLTNSQYGMRLSIDTINENLGGILGGIVTI